MPTSDDQEKAYHHQLDLKAHRITQLAGRIKLTHDSGLMLDLSIKLRKATQEMRALVHDHIVAQRRSLAASPAKEAAASERRGEGARFVEQWRAEHADDVYGESWTCPLCGKVIQVGSSDPAHDQFVSVLAEKHQRFHGDDWSRYQAAVQADGGEEAGGCQRSR